MLWDAYDIANECYRVGFFQKNAGVNIEMTDTKTFITRNNVKSVSSDYFFPT